VQVHHDVYGLFHWQLGLEIKHDCATCVISLSQKAYIDTIVSHFNLEDARPISTPMEPGLHQLINQCPTTVVEILQLKNISYYKAIGSLMYAALSNDPDIYFAITRLSQYAQNTGKPHWEAINVSSDI